VEKIKPLHRIIILTVSVVLVIIIAAIVYHYFSPKDILRLNFSDKQSLEKFVNKSNGSVHGEPKFVKESIGSALNFDGKSYVDYGSSEKLIDVIENVTIESWIKPRKISSNQSDTVIVMKGNYLFGLTRDERGAGDVIYGYINSGSNNVKVYISPEYWNHVVLVYDRKLSSKNIKIYVNGVIRGEKDFNEPVLLNIDHIFVGGNGIINFNGLIGSVNIYNKALTEEEIKKSQQESMGSTNK
jgi:hypothetical protein